MPRFELTRLPKIPLLAVRSKLMRHVSRTLLVAIVSLQVLLLWPSYNAERTELMDSLQREVTASIRTAAHPYLSERLIPDYRGAADAISHVEHTGHVMGGIVFDENGNALRRFGEPLYYQATELARTRTDVPGQRLEYLITGDDLNADLSVALRVDTSWIPAQTATHLWRVLGILLAMSLALAAVATLVVTHTIVEPLFALRSSLAAAGRDLTNAAEFAPPRHGQGVLNDIAKIIQQLLQRVSQTFREELMTFAAMVEHTGDAVFAYDSDGFLVYANKACLTYCGAVTLRELKDMGGPRFLTAPDAPPQTLGGLLESDSFSGEVDLMIEGREPLRCLMSGARLRREDGRVLRTFASLSDISVIREAQWAVEEKNSELEEANRIKAEFLAQMSHELRTPLNAIIGFSEILSARPQDGEEDDEVHAFAKDINNSGHHLLGLINNILDLSKLEAGKQELAETNVDLVELAESAIAMLRETARKNGIELVQKVPTEPLVIKCDAIRIKQVLLNLLSNALKFTDYGGTVELGIREGADNVEVYVTDTGIGMKPEDIPKALQPFAQLDSGISRRFEGTGLGLPICSGLVELHGGKMDIESTYGKGTTISFTIPSSRVVSFAA
jgi:signal transduction histidine kinase